MTCGDCTSPLGWRTRAFWQLMWLRLHGNKIRFVLGRSRRSIHSMGLSCWTAMGLGKRSGSDTYLAQFCYLGSVLNNSPAVLSSDIRAFTHPVYSIEPAQQGTERACRQISQSPHLQYTSTGEPRGNHVCIHLQFQQASGVHLGSWMLLYGEMDLPGEPAPVPVVSSVEYKTSLEGK